MEKLAHKALKFSNLLLIRQQAQRHLRTLCLTLILHTINHETRNVMEKSHPFQNCRRLHCDSNWQTSRLEWLVLFTERRHVIVPRRPSKSARYTAINKRLEKIAGTMGAPKKALQLYAVRNGKTTSVLTFDEMRNGWLLDEWKYLHAQWIW